MAGESQGPVDREGLLRKAVQGELQRTTPVWREGLADWVAAESLDFVFPKVAIPPPPPLPTGPPPLPAAATQDVRNVKGMLGGIGARISAVAELPTISNLNVKEILMGGLHQKTGEEDIEEIFAVGTRATTPALSEVPQGWPSPRVFWRVLGGCVAAYVLLRLGVTMFENANFIPGIIVVGSFIVPLSCVILFFEFNTPKNVSIYQVVKMVLIGGAVSLILTMVMYRFLPGAGTGDIVPALLTGVAEETGKALTLVLVLGSMRYPWQLNGMLFGAAVGAGFAGFESAGYAYKAGAGLFDSIMLRAVLAPGGHVIWTAMVGAAIWRVKGNKKFAFGMLFHPIVIRRYAIAVVLHGLWDSSILAWYIQLPILSIIGWYLILAMLKQAYEGMGAVQTAELRRAAA